MRCSDVRILYSRSGCEHSSLNRDDSMGTRQQTVAVIATVCQLKKWISEEFSLPGLLCQFVAEFRVGDSDQRLGTLT